MLITHQHLHSDSVLLACRVEEWVTGTTHLFGWDVAIDGGSYYSPPVVNQTRQKKLNYVELCLRYPIPLYGVMLH